MPANNATTFPAAGTDPTTDLRIDCYVRSAVPGPIAATIESVVDRLQRLSDRDRITDYEITLWPPAHDPSTDSKAATRTRDSLVDTFEQWADRHGYSLAPAFRRETIPSSPLGCGPGEPHERVRVPLVALVVRETDSRGERADDRDLRGIVPCTDTSSDRTYTVDDWLSAIERGDIRSQTFRADELTVINSQ